MDWLIDFFSFWFSEWRIAGSLFAITWLLAAIFAFFIRYRKNSLITPTNILFVGTFISALMFFLPIYSTKLSFFPALLNSFQHGLRLFALDGDIKDWVIEFGEYPNKATKSFYITLGSMLHAFAPILTFGFILSFFKNLSAHLKYSFHFWTHTHVFSELNKKTLALATDLYNRRRKFLGIIPKTLLVFTDIVDMKEEVNLELIEDAKALGAILYRKDLESIRFKFRYSLRKLSFYIISEDESDTARHIEYIMKHYDLKKVMLRVFSKDIRSELLLPTKNIKNMKVARINEIQSLIYHNLDRNGMHLFERARDSEGEEKIISAVIVGLGSYGTEMLKALSWYCQVQGYRLKINAFDSDPSALLRFKNLAPELMSEKYNGQVIPGEPYYEIKIHPGVDVWLPEFYDELAKIQDATYIFVGLGNDNINLDISTRIRSLCERTSFSGDGHKPDIETIVYDSKLIKTMGITWDKINNTEETHGIRNFKKQPYNILMFGDLDHFYSADIVLSSEIVKAGWEVHWRYYTEGNEEKKKDKKLKESAERTFWQYSYNYYSSIAKAIHERLRVKLGLDIPGIDKPWEQRTEAEKLAIGTIEHVRWNAYMRADGYSYGRERNDLAKLHHNLVPVTKLDDETLRKDA